jgi:7-cyano-7-deazaguanine reductase
MTENKPKKLGVESKIPDTPNINILDPVTNPHPDINYISRFTCPEFTSICPVTGQPDFAKIIIDYLAHKNIVESKSLKLYLSSYRNHGAFHEDCTIQIAKDIIKTITPKWLKITAYWYPRGGIPIDVFYEYGSLPKGVKEPDIGINIYNPRA